MFLAFALTEGGELATTILQWFKHMNKVITNHKMKCTVCVSLKLGRSVRTTHNNRYLKNKYTVKQYRLHHLLKINHCTFVPLVNTD